MLCPEMIPGLLILLVMVLGGLWYRSVEKTDWNSGYCDTCGTKWKNFDTDSQGGRGYVCGCSKHYIWVSYSVDQPPQV